MEKPDVLTPRLGEFSRALNLGSVGEANMKQALHHYHAAVEWGVDQQVGRLLDTLDRQRANARHYWVIHL